MQTHASTMLVKMLFLFGDLSWRTPGKPPSELLNSKCTFKKQLLCHLLYAKYLTQNENKTVPGLMNSQSSEGTEIQQIKLMPYYQRYNRGRYKGGSANSLGVENMEHCMGKKNSSSGSLKGEEMASTRTGRERYSWQREWLCMMRGKQWADDA